MKIKDKKIIVTGAASGIGKELTLQLLSNGAHVSALDINEENLKKLKEETRNDKLSTYVVDMSNKDSIENFRNKFLLDGHNTDIIINNAGIIQPFVNVDEIDDKTIDKVMNVNFFGPLRLIRLFLSDLIKKSESYIVNVSSMGGFFPFPKQTIYGASKAALKLFTEGLYSELIGTNTKVMIVLPGAINTDIAKNSNVNINNDSNYKMTSPKKAAELIINGIKENKFKLYIGSDSKIMNLLYNFNSKLAIKIISKKMKDL